MPKTMSRLTNTNAINAFVKKKVHTCSICKDDESPASKCIVNHCKTCKGTDKMVCRGCIVRIAKLTTDNTDLCYQCPHCRTKGLRQNWFRNDVAALTKLVDLFRTKLIAQNEELPFSYDAVSNIDSNDISSLFSDSSSSDSIFSDSDSDSDWLDSYSDSDWLYSDSDSE